MVTSLSGSFVLKSLLFLVTTSEQTAAGFGTGHVFTADVEFDKPPEKTHTHCLVYTNVNHTMQKFRMPTTFIASYVLGICMRALWHEAILNCYSSCNVTGQRFFIYCTNQ